MQILGLGTFEWLLIAFVLLLLFGARKLPELGRSIGSFGREIKKGFAEEDKKSAKKTDTK